MKALDEIRGRAESALCNRPEHTECIRKDRDRLLGAVEYVLDLHKPDADTGKCAECTPAKFSPMSVPWPCPTVKAITSAIEAGR